MNHFLSHTLTFLSIQAQDFIEDPANAKRSAEPKIPECSNSGFH